MATEKDVTETKRFSADSREILISWTGAGFTCRGNPLWLPGSGHMQPNRTQFETRADTVVCPYGVSHGAGTVRAARMRKRVALERGLGLQSVLEQGVTTYEPY